MDLQLPPTLRQLRVACSQCNLMELCLPVGLSEEDVARIEELVGTRRKLRRHQALYETRMPF